MNALTTILAKAASMVVLLLAVAACDNQGPMEAAGEKMDEATTNLGNKVEDACEEAKEGMGAKDTDC